MNIAYTIAPGRGDTDLLLLEFAEWVVEHGHRPCGIVQINSQRDEAGPCDMDVKVLPDGKVIRISQNLGRESKGCRLDPSALETAAGLVATQLESGADILIVNKFGKHEAEGRGFRPVIAEALTRGIPALVGLSRLNAAAFHEFTAQVATPLQPEFPALIEWMNQVIRNSGKAA